MLDNAVHPEWCPVFSHPPPVLPICFLIAGHVCLMQALHVLQLSKMSSRPPPAVKAMLLNQPHLHISL